MQKKHLITQIFLLYAKIHTKMYFCSNYTDMCVRYVRFYTRWHRRENDQFSTLKRTKTDDTQPKLNVVCFVVQSCLTDADFVIFLNYCLISTRLKTAVFTVPFLLSVKAFLNQRFCCLTMRRKRHNCRSSLYTCLFCGA